MLTCATFQSPSYALSALTFLHCNNRHLSTDLYRSANNTIQHELCTCTGSQSALHLMATSFLYIYIMATGFFYIYIYIYIYKLTERPVVLLNAIFKNLKRGFTKRDNCKQRESLSLRKSTVLGRFVDQLYFHFIVCRSFVSMVTSPFISIV